MQKTIEALFKGTTTIGHLKSIGITTTLQLTQKCTNNGKMFVPLEFPSLNPGDAGNINLVIAHTLCSEKLISKKELTRQIRLSSYYGSLMKPASVNALRFHSIRTVGDIEQICLEKGVFVPIQNKKRIGTRTNYDAACVLHKVGLLSRKEFLKVKMPTWRTRILHKEEIGEEGDLRINALTHNWTSWTKSVIVHAVTLKFPDIYQYRKLVSCWEEIKLWQLIQTFVRVHSNGSFCFYRKGHYRSRWYMSSINIERFDKAFDEIEAVLKYLNFVT
jgi:hypothetical protein